MIARCRSPRFHRRLMLLSLVAVLGMGALEGYEIIHEVWEVDCPGRESGNPAACPLCSNFHLLTVVAAEATVLPPAEFTGLLEPAGETMRQSVWLAASHPGRSPPRAS